jgi:5-dehydro-2-deoxygluconokinase
MGALLAALHAGVSLDDAVIRGSAAAAIVVSRAGCASAMPDKDTLDNFMAQNTASAYGAS